MDYDGLSSPESTKSLPVFERSEPKLTRFAILWHALPLKIPSSVDGSRSVSCRFDSETRSSHFDLLLEQNERLITFELQQLPIPGEKIVVRPLPDHRLVYLEYEGPISGDRGHVTQWTSGHYTTIADTDERWILELQSHRLSARLVLIRPPKAELLAVNHWHLRASRWHVTAIRRDGPVK